MTDTSLREELAELAAAESGGGEYRGMYDLLVREGETYSPIEVPAELSRRVARTPHKCFQRCYSVAIDTGWTYVEGVAVDPGSVWFPVHHAWLTKDGVVAVDLARPFDSDREYLGVPIQSSSLARPSALERLNLDISMTTTPSVFPVRSRSRVRWKPGRSMLPPV